MNGFGDRDGAMAEVAALGVKIGFHGADMSKPDEIEDMVRYEEAAFGGADVLVNSAGSSTWRASRTSLPTAGTR